MKITLNSVTFAGLKIMKLQTCTLPPQGLSTHTKKFNKEPHAARGLTVQEGQTVVTKQNKHWSYI
jgi:hypothetical protein